MHTPLKYSSSYLHSTPPQTSSILFNAPTYLQHQYGQRLTNLDDKITYLEKLMALMRIPYSNPNINIQIPSSFSLNNSEELEKTLLTLKSPPPINELLTSEKVLWSLLQLLGIEPNEFKSSFWSLDEAFILALRDQLNIDRRIEDWKAKLRKFLGPPDFEDFFKELEDLLLVCVMTIDYLRRFKKKETTFKPEVNKKDRIITKEQILQVDTIPNYEDIIARLKQQLEESEQEKVLLTKIFSIKVDGLHKEIKVLELKNEDIEHKRNEVLEVVKEGAIERGYLQEEIEALKKKEKEEEGDNENEEKKRAERRKKYALIDDLHGRLKVSDHVNKLLAERLEEFLKKNKRLEESLKR